MEEDWVDADDWCSTLIEQIERNTTAPDYIVTAPMVQEMIDAMLSYDAPQEWKEAVLEGLKQVLSETPYKVGR